MKNVLIVLSFCLTATYGVSQPPPLTINNTLNCDMLVTVYCGNDVGCDAACSVTICVPAMSTIPQTPCSIDCWYWGMAIVCPADPCPTVCGNTPDACHVVGWNNCNGYPTIIMGNIDPPCPTNCLGTITVDASTPNMLNIGP
ncbi:MAG: hypothetical protein WEC59_03080 [Salibacteraceae bacterium]